MKNLDPSQPQALLILGVLSPDSDLLKKIEPTLEDKFGPIALRSEIVPFDWTDYYNVEMGGGILRRWLICTQPVNLIESWRFKLESGEIEEQFMHKGKRRINLDPGFIRLDGLWLLSTKAVGHRTYLDKGVWIELTLRFLREHCEEMPWTYPDHRDVLAQAFFLKGRDLLKKVLRDV